jgi:hypothetical protein
MRAFVASGVGFSFGSRALCAYAWSSSRRQRAQRDFDVRFHHAALLYELVDSHQPRHALVTLFGDADLYAAFQMSELEWRR